MIASLWHWFYPATQRQMSCLGDPAASTFRHAPLGKFIQGLLCACLLWSASAHAVFYCSVDDNNTNTHHCGSAPIMAVQAHQDSIVEQQNISVATWDPKPIYGPITVTSCTEPVRGGGNCQWTQTVITGYGEPTQANGSRSYRQVGGCPSGTSLQHNNQCLPAPPQTFQEQKMLGPQCDERGNPCNPGNGNKTQTEEDFRDLGTTLSLTRSYNSYFGKDVGFGFGWSSPFHKRLEINYVLLARNGNGRGEPFSCASGTCTGDADSRLMLNTDSSGYTLAFRDGRAERYDLVGKLSSETNAQGQAITYNYDTSGRLSSVKSVFGHTYTLGYNASNHVATVTDPSEKLIKYFYNNINNLLQVNYPDNTAKLYYYEDTNNPRGLTGIAHATVNPDGSLSNIARFSTYNYHYNSDDITDTSNGKAISTEHALTDNGAPQEKFSFHYNSATQTTVTDPVNMSEVMTFATNLGVKNLTNKVNQSDSKSVQQTFDANNNLTCRKDEENRVTTYTYNTANQRVSTTEGLSGTDCNTCLSNPANCNAGGVGRVTTYEYLSPTLDLPRFIRRPSVASGQTFETELVYGDAGHPNQPTQVIQRGYTPTGSSVSRTVSLGYNAFGQVNSINGPRTNVNDVTTLEYYECATGGGCGQLKKVANALGHITTYDLYDANGRLRQMTDSNGLVTAYAYDPRGRVKTITRSGGGISALWQYSYTPWGDVSQIVDPDGVVLNYQYDAAHDLRFIVDAAGNYIHYKYDLKGNRIGEDIYDAGGNLKRTMGYVYDLRNHLSSVTSAGNITQLVFDAVGNLLSESPNADGVNRTTQHQYDALNRLMQTVDAVNGASAPTHYTHDHNDHPQQVTAPNNLSTQYSYDDLGNLLKEISPDRGTTLYTYDAAGNVLTLTDARGKVASYDYDVLNRVIEQHSNDAATPRYNYVYDACGAGRLCNVWENDNTHLIFSYDGLGRRNYELDSNWLYAMYAYTPGGRISHITYPDGRTVDYAYNNLGQVIQVSITSGATNILASNLVYHPFGPVKNLTYGNGKTLTALVDSAYRPTFRSDGTGTYFQNIIAYDGADNITQRYAPGLQSYTYDALNRLGSATDTATGSFGSLSYLYDSNGNRQSETRNDTTTSYIYSPADSNWLYKISTDGRVRDAAGNTQWSSATYALTYDGYGRLTSSYRQGAIYGYNALNQRITKTVGGNTVVFHYGPEGELLYESDNTGARVYVYLNNVPLVRVDNNANIYYYHTDHLGTPRAMTNSAGTTVWKALYEPFGKATVTVNTITNNLRLAGMYADAETGLYYWNSRYYDPKTGRGIQPDRMSVAEHVQRWQANMGSPYRLPLEINPYVYVANNPLRWIDLYGFEAEGIYSRPLAHFPDVPGTPRHWNVCDQNNCTGYFDDSTTRTDTNPNAPGTLLLSLNKKQTDCMKYWMKSCQDSQYDFLAHNCQQCVFYSGILCGVPNLPSPQVGPFPNISSAPRRR